MALKSTHFTTRTFRREAKAGFSPRQNHSGAGSESFGNDKLRRSFLSYFLLALFFVTLSMDLFAQGVGVSVSTEKREYKTGEPIIVKVDANYGSNITGVELKTVDSLGLFAVLDIKPSEIKTDGEQTQRSWFVTTMTFDSGNVIMNPVEILYTTGGDTTKVVARSNPLFLTIVPTPVDMQSGIRDVKPVVDAPWKFEDYLPFIIGVVVLAAAIAGYWYWRKKKKQSTVLEEYVKPTLSPHEEALFALRELEEKKLWQQGLVKQYYSEATEIVRRYFERRFAFPALEMTSDEILQKLKSFDEVQQLNNEPRTFFTTADLVKFAKYEPTVPEHENELKWAYEIVRTTMQKIQVTEEETANVR
jgi:hypothetical protein